MSVSQARGGGKAPGTPRHVVPGEAGVTGLQWAMQGDWVWEKEARTVLLCTKLRGGGVQLLPEEATWRVERKGRWAAGKVGWGAQIGAP